MKKETFEILEKAISDVGYWRWWITGSDSIQLEFGGTLLLNSNTLDENSMSAQIALRFSGNSFLTFFDKNEKDDWHIKLHKDEIEPFTVDDDFFGFNNKEMINEIETEYTNKIVIREQNRINGIKNILVFEAGNVAVIIGGDIFCVVDQHGKIDDEIIDETILERSKLWWIYWKDYWKKRETNEAYNKDYACEVTIPMQQ